MKFHETNFEEYLSSINKCDVHPELGEQLGHFQNNISTFGNLIVYGPSGVGKYSQILKILKKYSPSELKYDKRMTIQTEKQEYIYRISDIHYEIDMALLGCNSTLLWHEIFTQIVDIVSMKQEKNGIILCKNFHMIHNELLLIFYSYMQQYNHPNISIQINFILMSEHISFIPNAILNNCHIVSVKRPSNQFYKNIISNIETNKGLLNIQQSGIVPLSTNIDANNCLKNVDYVNILNMKELHLLTNITSNNDIPTDFFNIICDQIIQEMQTPNKIVITEFRDLLYDILVYNLDVGDCIWYILTYFVNVNKLNKEDISLILDKTYTFFKQYNNNYRPIYHLENIFFYITNKINGFQEYIPTITNEL
jgi:hypothetical protein